MTLFWSIAAALTAAALLFLLPPLLRARPTRSAASRPAANASIYREQLEELAADLQRGALTKEEFARASRDIERRIVAEHVEEAGAGAQAQRRAPLAAAIAIAVLVPLLAGLGYWRFGNPGAIGGGAEGAHSVTREQMESLVERLWTRMQQTPDDPEGWMLLGRSFAVLGQHERSAQAYARAAQLVPNDAGLLADYADALAMARGRKLEGEPTGKASSQNETLALKGIVSLDPGMAGKVSPGDTVFVVARPVSGPRMPLAVARTTVAKLPYSFTLDDSMAMAPGATISSHPKVVIAARVSKSGNAAPQQGDLEGTSAPVAPGASGVRVVISRVVD